MVLVDDRYEPPRLSPWWLVGIVVVDVVCLAIIVATVGEGRWIAAGVFAGLLVSATVGHIQLRRRHRAAFAGWTPPSRPVT